MTPKKVKKLLIDKDLTIVRVAKGLIERGVTEGALISVTNMLSDMIHGRAWYQNLDIGLREFYGISLVKPKQFERKNLRRAV